MAIFIEIAALTLFVATSGLLFRHKFDDNKLAVGLAALLASIGSYFLLEELAARFASKHVSQVAAPQEAFSPKFSGNADSLFSADVMAELHSRAESNSCAKGCSDGKFDMFRLPLDNKDSRRAYLVTTEDMAFCGSGGCSNAVILFEDNKQPLVLKEGHGISDRQALLVAREAIVRIKR